MSADIHELRGDGFGDMYIPPIGKAEGDAILPHQIEYLRDQPCCVAKFDDAADFQFRGVRLQGGEKDLQPFQIHLESGRQLEEHGTQALFQVFGSRKKEIQRFFRVFEPFDVGQKPAGFDGKQELWWNLGSPVLERDFTRQTVKAVIDFDGVEVPGEEPKPLAGLHIFRVKLAIPPVFIVPAARSDINLCHCFEYIRLQLEWQVLHSNDKDVTERGE